MRVDADLDALGAPVEVLTEAIDAFNARWNAQLTLASDRDFLERVACAHVRHLLPRYLGWLRHLRERPRPGQGVAHRLVKGRTNTAIRAWLRKGWPV